jgi:Kef-type K+ transport system membrane component KefB
MDDVTAWEIEDLTEARSGLGAGHTNRWFGVAIAVLAAVVGLGFIGRSATGRRSRRSSRRKRPRS